MANKKTPKPPNNDFAVEENIDICGFSAEPIIAGECIASFSFDDDPTNESNESASTKTIDFNNSNINSLADINNSTDKIFDNISSNTSIESISKINCLSGSINKLNTIISTKLGVVIDNDVSGDDSHKVA